MSVLVVRGKGIRSILGRETGGGSAGCRLAGRDAVDGLECFTSRRKSRISCLDGWL